MENKLKPDYIIKATAKCFEKLVKINHYKVLDEEISADKRIVFEVESELFMLCSLLNYPDKIDTDSQMLIYKIA